jgi:hypothetical protein
MYYECTGCSHERRCVQARLREGGMVGSKRRMRMRRGWSGENMHETSNRRAQTPPVVPT